jgi:hypothetical protein
MVMATGIVSIATQEELRGVLSAALATVAGAAWVVLLILSGARLVRATRSVRDELKSPAAAPDFFAFVAAAGVLGVRAVIAGRDGIGLALWTVGALAWLVLVVAVPVAVRARGHTPPWWAASGNWLLAVVATQSLAVLAGGLAEAGWPRLLLLVVALCCWVMGLALYAALIAAIGVRVLSSQPLRPGSRPMTGSSWERWPSALWPPPACCGPSGPASSRTCPTRCSRTPGRHVGAGQRGGDAAGGPAGPTTAARPGGAALPGPLLGGRLPPGDVQRGHPPARRDAWLATARSGSARRLLDRPGRLVGHRRRGDRLAASAKPASIRRRHLSSTDPPCRIGDQPRTRGGR